MKIKRIPLIAHPVGPYWVGELSWLLFWPIQLVAELFALVLSPFLDRIGRGRVRFFVLLILFLPYLVIIEYFSYLLYAGKLHDMITVSGATRIFYVIPLLLSLYPFVAKEIKFFKVMYYDPKKRKHKWIVVAEWAPITAFPWFAVFAVGLVIVSQLILLYYLLFTPHGHHVFTKIIHLYSQAFKGG